VGEDDRERSKPDTGVVAREARRMKSVYVEGLVRTIGEG